MIDILPFANSDQCSLLPQVIVGAVKCGECDADHGHFISLGFLFWGLEIVWIPEEDVA